MGGELYTTEYYCYRPCEQWSALEAKSHASRSGIETALLAQRGVEAILVAAVVPNHV
jgi:hypothetical protein